ncbi:hypothetical protein R1sor_013192 [Riccia sorocarpa]|uniref:Uncharacterized protein n=1 Tax=Riccia sorocarpa TaxID=122646 RepID=A0ABD3H5T6_9MARC
MPIAWLIYNLEEVNLKTLPLLGSCSEFSLTFIKLLYMEAIHNHEVDFCRVSGPDRLLISKEEMIPAARVVMNFLSCLRPSRLLATRNTYDQLSMQIQEARTKVQQLQDSSDNEGSQEEVKRLISKLSTVQVELETSLASVAQLQRDVAR